MAESDQSAGDAAWDARQKFVEELEKKDEYANNVKSYMESRPSPGETVTAFKTYFSILRWMYRKIRHFAKDNSDKNSEKYEENSRQYLDNEIIEMRKQLNTFVNSSMDAAGNVRDRIQVPVSLEDRMENFHIKLNEIRFNSSLVVPIRKSEQLSPEEAAYTGMNE